MRANRLLPLLGLSLLSCYTKDAGFFPTVNLVNDEDGPVFQSYSPAPNLTGPFNINTFSFEVVDLPGSNGAPASGVDVNSIEVLLGPNAVPATRNGNRYSVDLTDFTNGPVVMNLSARDLYGNSTGGVVNFFLKRTPPVVNLSDAPPQTWQSNNPLETLSYSGTITDPFLGVAVGSLYRAGDDGQCREDNSLLWPANNGTPGTVSQNTFNYGLSGQFQINVNAWNGVLPGGTPKIGRYCLGITAEDRATDATGAPNRNRVTVFHRSELEWGPPPGVTSIILTPDNITLTHPATQQMTAQVNADPGVPLGITWTATPPSVGTIDQNGLVTTVGPGQLDVQACSVHSPNVCGTARLSVQNAPFDFKVSWALLSWNHVAFNGGLSNTCGRGKATVTQGTQGLAGAPYTVTWTGPGVTGTTTRSGTLDANGEFFDRQPIVAFGNYTANMSVTVNGITRTASGTTSVNAGAGTCPPP